MCVEGDSSLRLTRVVLCSIGGGSFSRLPTHPYPNAPPSAVVFVLLGAVKHEQPKKAAQTPRTGQRSREAAR